MRIMNEVRKIVHRFARLKSDHGPSPGYGYITPSLEISRPVPVLYPLFKQRPLDTVSIGSGFVVGVQNTADKGVISTQGVNCNLQLGQSSGNSGFATKTWTVEDKVIKLKSGRAHTLALTHSGSVYLWGSNSMGQLGRASDVKALPFSALEIYGIKDIATGLDNSFLLTNDGEVLSTGWAADGQTGCGNTNMLHTFTRVNLSSPVTQISCSADSTLVLCDNGKVLGWGNNEYHQVSPSPEMQAVSPTEISVPEEISHLAAGGSFSLFIGKSGKLYSCGYGPGSGHYGLGAAISPVTTCSYKITYISASLDHACAITDNNTLLIWGRGQHNKLISVNDADQYEPRIYNDLQDNKVKEVVCGPSRTCIITSQPIPHLAPLGMIECSENKDVM